jgi:hypothetical protein
VHSDSQHRIDRRSDVDEQALEFVTDGHRQGLNGVGRPVHLTERRLHDRLQLITTTPTAGGHDVSE